MHADIVAMQSDAIAQILHIRAQMEIRHGELAAQNAQLRTEQEQLRLTLERLQFEHESLRAILDRLDLFDQTANAVENGLLSLALLKKPGHNPQ